MSQAADTVPAVTLRSTTDDDEYRPEYGLLQMRDHYVPGRYDGPDDVVEGLDALEESDATGYPTGTVALAGVAWLQAPAADAYHRVRLEAHDAAPVDDAADWAAVMETPYFCRTGAVHLTGVTGTSDGATLPLGIGLFRVRVARRPADDEGEVWRLQFWPDPTMRLPRWHKRPSATADPGGTGGRSTRQRLAGDLISLLLWTGSAPTTIVALARRLGAGVDDVTAAIGDQLDRHLRLEAGDPTDPQRPIVLAVQPRPALPPAAVVAPPPPAPGPPWQPVPAAPEPPPEDGALYWLATGGPPRTVTYRPPVGAPPRAGYITDAGELMVWRAGELDALARVADYPGTATETAHGILLTGARGNALVRGDGTIDDLDLPGSYGRLDEHGRLYAVVEWHLGRREWYRLHVVDLADGSRRTMPWDESQELILNAVHDGAVRFNTTMQWRIGHDPEPAPYPVSTIDPVSGTALYHDPQQGMIVTGRDGVPRRFTGSYQARLAPGGARLYEFVHSPPSLVLFDAATSRTTQTYWLPSGSQTSAAGPQPPIWDDRTHLLVHVPHGMREIGAPVVRLDVTTGRFEGVPLAGQAEHARLVRPLL